MREVPDLICAERAAGAGMFRPTENTGLKKGTIDDQLPPALKQIEQAYLTARSVEIVRSLNGHPWHPAPLCSQRVTGAC